MYMYVCMHISIYIYIYIYLFYRHGVPILGTSPVHIDMAEDV